MQENLEKVILRTYKDEFFGTDCYVAVFPQTEANMGAIAVLPFVLRDSDGKPCFMCFDEAAMWWYYENTKPVKQDEAARLLPYVEKHCDCKLRLSQRMTADDDRMRWNLM